MSSGWWDRALCRHFPALSWIADPEQRSVTAERAMAAVCTACPASGDCDAYAADVGVTSGFWAGHDRTPDRDQEVGAA